MAFAKPALAQNVFNHLLVDLEGLHTSRNRSWTELSFDVANTVLEIEQEGQHPVENRR